MMLVAILLGNGLTFAQQASLSGKVLDRNTQQAVPFATVFFASTTFGSSANENGEYQILKVPKGKYDIIVSCVGYENAFLSKEFLNEPLQIDFVLTPKAVQLNEVVVDGAQNKKDLQLFLRLFLGSTPNSKQCRLENPEAVFLRYDREKRILSAEATEPLVIINHALGYRIHYLLDEFTVDQAAGMFRIFGIPRFEDLPGKNDRELRKWTRARDEAYFGSLNHLMRSLVKREVRKNLFAIQSPKGHQPINPDTLFNKENTSVLNFTGKLEVIYEGEKERREFRMLVTSPGMSPQPQPVQTSVINFLKPSLLLYDNGYFEDPKGLMLDGYLAWSEALSELVPLDYEPTEK